MTGPGVAARQAIEQSVDPLQAINQGFVVGLDEVGEQFGCGEMFLPDLVQAAETMLKLLGSNASNPAYRPLIGEAFRFLRTSSPDVHFQLLRINF